MPSTSSGRAPSSRLHRSAPRLRQQHLPPRDRSGAATTRTPSTLPRARKQRQSTLTQLDFATSFSREYDTESPDEEESARWEAPVAKKKRKVSRNMASESQNTLTQMPFLLCPDSDDDEVQPLMEDESQPLVVDESQDPSEQSNSEVVLSQMLHGHAKHPIKPEPQSPQLASPSQRGVAFDIAEDPSSPSAPNAHGPCQSIFDTPQKLVKQEVPSSQSPALSPISRNLQHSVSPSKRPRPTLGEMTISELFRRDAQLENTPTKRTKHTDPIQDSCAEDDGSDEIFDPEAENNEPDWPAEFKKGTPRSQCSRGSSPKAPSSSGSHFEESQIRDWHVAHDPSSKRTPQKSGRPAISGSSSSAFDLDLDDILPMSSPRRRRIASSPAGLQQEMFQEQYSGNPEQKSPSPRRTLFKVPAPPPSSARSTGSLSRIRTSQASTIGPTQGSPQRVLVPSSPVMSMSTAPTRGMTPLPETGRSLEGIDDSGRMTALSVPHSSGQIQTVSQLLGDSQSEDEFYDA